MNRTIAVLGCGWLGLPLAVSFLKKGYPVKGSTTSEEKLSHLNSNGIQPYLIHISQTGIIGAIGNFFLNVDVLIINVPPRLRREENENYVKKIQFLFKEVKRSVIKQIIFVSSTSVYGNIEGEVNENTTPKPSTESGIQLLKAETIFQNAEDLQTTVLRFGGLIGDDRHPIQMLSGKKELSNGNHYVNLIHRLDCIRIIEYIIETDMWGEIINGVYPYHPTKQRYYRIEAQKKNLQPPDYKKYSISSGKKVMPYSLLNSKEFCFKMSI